MAGNMGGGKNQNLPTGRLVYGSDGTNNWPVRANTTTASSTEATPYFREYPEKTVQTELYAAASLAASTQAASTILNLAGISKATVFIDHGRAATAAFGTNGTEYRVEVSQKASGNDTWRPIASVLAGSAAASSIRYSPAIAAADTTVTVVSTTTVVLDDLIMIANTASAASIEWARVTLVTGTASFQVADGFTYAAASTHVIYNKAEQFTLTLGVEGVTRMRVAINNNASGTSQAIYSRIACITK